MILTEYHVELIKNWVKKQIPGQYDKLDIDSLIDRNISIQENKTILQEYINYNQIQLEDYDKSQEEKYKLEQQKRYNQNWYKDILKTKTMVILGNCGSGKTALAYHILETIKHKIDIYVLKHPNPKLMIKRGYKNLNSMEKIIKLQNAVIWIDEPQLLFPIGEKKNNEVLSRIISIARHKNLIFLMSSSETRWFNRNLEAYIDIWIIKDLDYSLIKQGSKAKNIIKNSSIFSPDEFNLSNEEYIISSRTLDIQTQRETFELPKFFDENYSKPFRNY